jgi:sugar/nucleoside kinase (ribokinase family)
MKLTGMQLESLKKFKLNVKKETPFTIISQHTVYTSRDSLDPIAEAMNASFDYNEERKKHLTLLEQHWNRALVEIEPFGDRKTISMGSAVLQGAITASRCGLKILVITRQAKADSDITSLLNENNVTVYSIPSRETSWIFVRHPGSDPDEREMILKKNAGFFTISDIPEVNSGWIHLAGISDREFTLSFIRGLKKRGCPLSIDMQGFVRQVEPVSRRINYKDVDNKKEIVSLMHRIKLDVREAEILAKTNDPGKASEVIRDWGCPEVMITGSNGICLNYQGEIYWERFTSQTIIGRNGRGDTSFAAYLSRRLTDAPREALKFAASLVSIKMESPGFFKGTINDVKRRMRKDGRT